MAAAIFAMLGQGGGRFYTPTRTWFGVNFNVAATASLFLIMVMPPAARGGAGRRADTAIPLWPHGEPADTVRP